MPSSSLGVGAGWGGPAHAARPHRPEVRSGEQEATEPPGWWLQPGWGCLLFPASRVGERSPSRRWVLGVGGAAGAGVCHAEWEPPEGQAPPQRFPNFLQHLMPSSRWRSSTYWVICSVWNPGGMGGSPGLSESGLSVTGAQPVEREPGQRGLPLGTGQGWRQQPEILSEDP